MFSAKKQLIKKTGKHGVGRFTFLEQLVNEYKTTKSRDSKEQVLANLANFAYDPVNYEYLWRLKVLDLFLTALDDRNKTIVSFAIGGICNICLEPISREYIIRTNGIQLIAGLLSSSTESIILSSITALIYLDTPVSRKDVTSPEIVERMLEFSKDTNRRIKNLANIFLQDLCGICQDPKKSSTTNTSASKSSTKRSIAAATSTSNSTSLPEKRIKIATTTETESPASCSNISLV